MLPIFSKSIIQGAYYMAKLTGIAAMVQSTVGKSMKTMTGVSVGFHDPDTWISTGSYALNYRISGDFYNGVPLGKVVVFAGDSGAGKSYLVSGNIVRNAQEQGIYVVVIDTENALDEAWLAALGVDTSIEKMAKINMCMIDDVAKLYTQIIEGYKQRLASGDDQKLLIVIDSLGMLQTPTEVDQVKKGDIKGDMGRKAKQLKTFVTNAVNGLGACNVGLVATNHTYASQDMFDPDPKISGGSGFVYAASILVAMGLGKLKVDEDGTKTSTVHGIRARCMVRKTRYTKPFEQVVLDIPYKGGLNPYSGLFDMFESMNLLTKDGNSYVYVDIETGERLKFFRKVWEKNTDGCLDLIMRQFKTNPIVQTHLREAEESANMAEDEMFGMDDEFFDTIEDDPEQPF